MVHPLKTLSVRKPAARRRPVENLRITELGADAPPASGVSGVKPLLGRGQKRVPSWWKGEAAAYENAKAGMMGVTSLPKMGR